MKNNRGEMTTEEILKFVLAVAGILILLMLGYSLYKIFVQKTDLEQAREHLETIQGVIENLEAGEKTAYLLTGPRNWYLVGYSKADLVKNPLLRMPATCGGQDCLCLCDGKKIDPRIEDIPIDQYLPLAYLYYYFYYSLDDKVTSENFITLDGLPYRANGKDVCERLSSCIKVSNFSIDYAQSFEIVTSRSWGDFLNFDSSEGRKGIYVPWASLNETSIDLSIRREVGGKVIIGNDRILVKK